MMALGNWKRGLYFALFMAILVVIILFAPFRMTAVAKREFTILDGRNRPVEGAVVKQVWYQYAVGHTDEVEFKTGPDGRVVLPPRLVETTIANLLAGAVLRIVEFKLDANVGSTDSIGISVTNRDWVWFYDGIGLENGLVRLE